MKDYTKCRFISDGTWFDKDTEAECLCFWGDPQKGEKRAGIFKGIRTCRNPEIETRKLGEKYLDEEDCSFEEFEIIDVEKR